MVELSLTGDAPVNGLAITGGAVLVSPKQVLPDDDMRFLRTLVGLLDGAYTRIVAERTMFEAKRFEGVGRLAAGVAHDFNNLLMPICGSFDLVTAQHGSDEKLLKLIGPGYEAGLQARTLVQKLLVHAKSTEVKLEQVDLAALVRGNELLLRSFVPDGVELVMHFDASVVRVRADRVELQQVLLNLTLNALAAVGTSGLVNITVQEHNGFGRVVVIDDGPGIDPALRSWIFEPFNSTNPGHRA